MSILLHQLRRERVRMTDEQRKVVEQAIRRLLLGEIDEVAIRLRGPHLRVEHKREDRAQSV